MDEGTSVQLQEWIARLNAGDSLARDELIKRSMNRMRRLVRHSLAQFARLRRFEDTDDVLQGAMIRLMRRLETLRPPSVVDFLRLGATEIRRALIDLTRHYFGPQGAGTRETPLAPAGTDTSDYDQEPADSSFNAERLANWEEFHRQVELLPPEEHDVFAMIWYNDLKQEEVATTLGVSIPTVKRRWLAARLKLQRWMDGEAKDEDK